MMRKFLLLSCALLSAGAYANPSVSGVSGSLTQGSTVTISGSGISTKRNGQILFDNFADGNVGDPISARGAWTPFGGSNAPEYAISTANPYMGGRAARVSIGVNSNALGGDDFGDYYRYATGQTELYMEAATYLHYVVAGPSASGAQTKLFRAITDGEPTVAPDPILTITRFNANGSSATSTDAQVLQGGGDSSAATFWGEIRAYDSIPADTWNQFCLYTKLSTPGGADGMRFANINGKDDIRFSMFPGSFSDPANTGIASRAWNGVPYMTRSSGMTDTFRRLYLPFFKRDEMSLVVDIGYVYLNDSPERVVVHNAPTLAASTRYQVQKQVSRGASTITIEYQQGKLLSNDAKYVTVVNSDNTFSTSFLAGSSGPAPAVLPSPPGSFKAQALPSL